MAKQAQELPIDAATIKQSVRQLNGAIHSAFGSHTHTDVGQEDINIVDAVLQAGKSMNRIAEAIMPYVSAGGTDAAGAPVACLTEAVMGMTAGLCSIAEAISDLASAVRDRPN